eukprot:COSAG01_NODE_2815_length_7021_cov_7.545363_7_plen_100_part_00
MPCAEESLVRCPLCLCALSSRLPPRICCSAADDRIVEIGLASCIFISLSPAGLSPPKQEAAAACASSRSRKIQIQRTGGRSVHRSIDLLLPGGPTYTVP